jgi:hypothetical protein
MAWAGRCRCGTGAAGWWCSDGMWLARSWRFLSQAGRTPRHHRPLLGQRPGRADGVRLRARALTDAHRSGRQLQACAARRRSDDPVVAAGTAARRPAEPPAACSPPPFGEGTSRCSRPAARGVTAIVVRVRAVMPGPWRAAGIGRAVRIEPGQACGLEVAGSEDVHGVSAARSCQPGVWPGSSRGDTATSADALRCERHESSDRGDQAVCA